MADHSSPVSNENCNAVISNHAEMDDGWMKGGKGFRKGWMDGRTDRTLGGEWKGAGGLRRAEV